jgi:hypothetical protein
MSSYLISAIAYFHIFGALPLAMNVDFGKDTIQFFYPTL